APGRRHADRARAGAIRLRRRQGRRDGAARRGRHGGAERTPLAEATRPAHAEYTQSSGGCARPGAVRRHMRLVFAGTPDAAVPSLRALAATAHDVALVVTRPDAPLGRKRILTPSPVAAAAAELGLPVLKTARLDAAASERIAQASPDLGVIVAYGGLVREPLLSAPPHGWINLHFSLLPRWRGAAPVQHALIAGDDTLGAAVFQLVPD